VVNRRTEPLGPEQKKKHKNLAKVNCFFVFRFFAHVNFCSLNKQWKSTTLFPSILNYLEAGEFAAFCFLVFLAEIVIASFPGNVLTTLFSITSSRYQVKSWNGNWKYITE